MSALISITHRLSGIYVFFVTLPLAIILFQKALTELSYDSMSLLIQTSGIFSTFVYFSFLVFLYHILTGFRHLLMDVHIGENLKASNMSAVFVISFWLVVSIFVLFGFQIWAALQYGTATLRKRKRAKITRDQLLPRPVSLLTKFSLRATSHEQKLVVIVCLLCSITMHVASV